MIMQTGILQRAKLVPPLHGQLDLTTGLPYEAGRLHPSICIMAPRQHCRLLGMDYIRQCCFMIMQTALLQRAAFDPPVYR